MHLLVLNYSIHGQVFHLLLLNSFSFFIQKIRKFGGIKEENLYTFFFVRMSETYTMSNNEVVQHYLSSTIPDEIAKNLKEIFPEFGDLDDEEVLLQQVFQNLCCFLFKII